VGGAHARARARPRPGPPGPVRYRAASWAQQNEDVGFWDLMSWHGTGVLYSAWHQRKLGWLDADEMGCVTTEPARRTLAPLDGLDGGSRRWRCRPARAPRTSSSRAGARARTTSCATAACSSTASTRAAYGGNRPVVVKIAAAGDAGRPHVRPAAVCGLRPHRRRGLPASRTPRRTCASRCSDAADEGHDVRVSPLSAPPHPNSASCARGRAGRARRADPGVEPDEPPPTGEDPGGRPGLTPPLTEARSRDGERPPSVVTRTPLGVRLVAPAGCDSAAAGR
jgi:hypothetical protein